MLQAQTFLKIIPSHRDRYYMANLLLVVFEMLQSEQVVFFS